MCSHFWFWFFFSIGITSSADGVKFYVITAGINKYNSRNKKKRIKNDKIVLLAKSKLNSIEVLISKTLINSKISHDEFVLLNNALKKFYDIKEKYQKL